MAVNIRVRNGMEADAYGGGVTEGDLRGSSTDMIESASGVVDLAGGHLLVHQSASPDMNVIVDEGVGYIPNTSFDETDSDSIKFWEAVVSGSEGSRTLAIASNSSGQTRIDLICLVIDPGATPDNEASDVADLIRVAGTPGAGAPATPSYHVKLAEVTVLNGASTIPNAKIADSRVQLEIKNEFIPETLTGKTLSDSVIDPIAETYTPSAAATATLDLALSNEHRITMPAGNITIALSNPTNAQKFIVTITQDSGGSRTVTWFSTIRWVNGVAPTLTTTANKRDVFGFIRTGSGTYDGFIIGQNI